MNDDSQEGWLDGRWYDGVSSRAHAVRVRLAPEGMLEIDAGGDLRAWPLRDVAINPRLGSTPRVLRLPERGRVEVADSPLLAQWFAHPPSRIEHLADWLERRRIAITIAAVCIALATVAFVHFALPWIATRVAARVPPAVEQQISEQTVALLDRLYFSPSGLPAARQAALKTAFARLIEGEPRAAEMRLAIVDAPMIGANAFALPDGRIYMTDELAALADADDEILAVLAHEAGHHVHRHGMRQAIESSSVFLLAGLLLGDASGSSLAVSLPAALISNRFSRDHESEADAYAFALLTRRGDSPCAFAEIMRKLSADAPPGFDEEGPASYLSSHPASPARIKAAALAAKSACPARKPSCKRKSTPAAAAAAASTEEAGNSANCDAASDRSR